MIIYVSSKRKALNETIVETNSREEKPKRKPDNQEVTKKLRIEKLQDVQKQIPQGEENFTIYSYLSNHQIYIIML